jgi:Uncharacterized conserved protein
VVLAARARLASGFWEQLVGLIGQAPDPEFALGLPGCCQVHTALLALPLDIAFCDEAGRVVRLVAALAPWRISPRIPAAAVAWEMPAGCLAGRVRAGDVLLRDGV